MQFPYLNPRSAVTPMKLDEYVKRTRVDVMADNAQDKVVVGSSRKGQQNIAPPARITPEYKDWHARQMARIRSSK